jgi:hypothetical protein
LFPEALLKDPTDPPNNPMRHPEEPASGSDDAPKFGRLLIALGIAVALIGVVTYASEAWFTR